MAYYGKGRYGRYSKAQLNAISRSYSEKRKQEDKKVAEQRGLDKVFPYQSKYKTIRGLINASSENLGIATSEALEKAQKRKNLLIQRGAKKKEGSELYKLEKDIKVIKSVRSQSKPTVKKATPKKTATKKTTSKKSTSKKTR